MNFITPGAVSVVTVARDQISDNAVQQTDSREENGENRFVLSKRQSDTSDQNNMEGNTEGDQDSSDDSIYEEKIMTVYWKSGSLGAAYYNVHSGELCMLEEIVDRHPQYQMLGNLYRQVEPACIVAESKRQSAFVSRLRTMLFVDEGDRPRGRCKLNFISAKEYNYEVCKRRIFSLSLCGEPPHWSDEERAMYLRTVVNFNATCSVHALGTLLRYLDLNWRNLGIDQAEKPNYLRLHKISLADIMSMDEDTYRGLQIFNASVHPSAFKRGVPGSSREGLSLYSLFNKCCSTVGHARMKVLLRHPTRNVTTLHRRQDALTWLMSSQNESQLRNLCTALKRIRNVNGILLKIKSLTAKPYQWKSLYMTIYNALLVSEILEQARDSELLEEMASIDNDKLYQMALYMDTIIDFEMSRAENKFTIKQGLDSELDKKKQIMSNLHELMTQKAREELARLPERVAECNMLYMPHVGYLLAIKADAVGTPYELPGLRFMFTNDEYVIYKSQGCEELDVLIGDTYPEIRAHETKIMMRLVDVVLDNVNDISSLVDRCAELDCLIAMAKVCKEHGFVRPVFTTEKAIHIKRGKHPLHYLSSENFVPNDTNMSVEHGLVKVLTGANSCGKSVYMKQVALICYLAHVGSFVPAESAALSPLVRLHTRLQSTECVAAHMSAFLIDLQQTASALQDCDSNSLIILDEFGKGTSEVDGLALLAASLNHLLFQKEHCPLVMVSTHFLNIKDYLLKTQLVMFQTFEYIMQDGEPVFLFRLTEGACERSFALEVALASGLEPHLVKRAREVQQCIKENKLLPKNKKITTKLKTFIDSIKVDLLTEDI